jgi:hypothetical protein
MLWVEVHRVEKERGHDVGRAEARAYVAGLGFVDHVDDIEAYVLGDISQPDGLFFHNCCGH